MSGAMDLHAIIAIQEGWGRLAADQTRFRALFPGIPQAMVDSWFTELTPTAEPKKVKVRAAWAPGTEPLPLILVQLLDEAAEHEPLGGVGSHDSVTGIAYEEAIVRETVGVTILTDHPHLTRALHVSCRALMLAARPWFIDVGYLSLDYRGAQDVQPDPQMLPEGLEVFMRLQRWETLSQVTVAHEHHAHTKRPFVINADDATVDGDPGAVVPWPT